MAVVRAEGTTPMSGGRGGRAQAGEGVCEGSQERMGGGVSSESPPSKSSILFGRIKSESGRGKLCQSSKRLTQLTKEPAEGHPASAASERARTRVVWLHRGAVDVLCDPAPSRLQHRQANAHAHNSPLLPSTLAHQRRCRTSPEFVMGVAWNEGETNGHP
jgi:hypothetical protein